MLVFKYIIASVIVSGLRASPCDGSQFGLVIRSPFSIFVPAVFSQMVCVWRESRGSQGPTEMTLVKIPNKEEIVPVETTHFQ